MKSSALKLIPSFVQDKPLSLDERKPYLFFHIPKTAGLGFSSAMNSIYQHLRGRLPYQSLFARIDEVNTINGKKDLLSFEKLFTNFPQGGSGFVASHIPHHLLSTVTQPFKLITVLRDPVDRVVSSFGYYCMRNSIDTNATLFNEFINKEENRNITTKTILGINKATLKTGVLAAKVIKENFYAYCFVKDLDKMMSTILSIEGLPNLILGQENKTLDKYRYKISNEEKELVTELNLEDVNLVSTIGAGAIRLPEIDRGEQIHANSVLLEGSQTGEKYKADSSLVNTLDILPNIAI